MKTAPTPAKAGRPSRSLDEEIIVAEARLRALRDKKKEDERRDLERNQRAILALLKEEGLDRIAAHTWKHNAERLHKLLNSARPSEPAPSGPARERVAPAPAEAPAATISLPGQETALAP